MPLASIEDTKKSCRSCRCSFVGGVGDDDPVAAAVVASNISREDSRSAGGTTTSADPKPANASSAVDIQAEGGAIIIFSCFPVASLAIERLCRAVAP